MIIKGRKRVGRRPMGAEHALARLTKDDVPVIRQMIQQGHTIQAIATHFNVGRTTIRRVRDGQHWTVGTHARKAHS